MPFLQSLSPRPWQRNQPRQVPEQRESMPEGVVIKAVGTGLTESEVRTDVFAALSGILYSKVSSSIETTEEMNEIAGI